MSSPLSPRILSMGLDLQRPIVVVIRKIHPIGNLPGETTAKDIDDAMTNQNIRDFLAEVLADIDKYMAENSQPAQVPIAPIADGASTDSSSVIVDGSIQQTPIASLVDPVGVLFDGN